MSELKPCPFCGGEASIEKCWNFDDESPSGYFVWCHGNDCVVEPMTEDFKEEAEAIAAWNARTPEQAIAMALGIGTCELVDCGICKFYHADIQLCEYGIPPCSKFERKACKLESGKCEIALARLTDVAARVDIDTCGEILECVDAIRKAVKR